MTKLAIPMGLLALSMALSPSADAITPVDIELSLLVDISGSINNNEYDMQLQGYQSAFESDNLQNAIINGTEGKIAVQLIMWSGSSQQQVMIDWSLVDSQESANALAQSIGDLARPFSGMTAIGSAIDFASPLFDQNDYQGYQQIIDISGDGTNNSGLNVATASDNAIENGVDTINGIVITNSQSNGIGIGITNSQSVVDQYTNDVINGESPFLLVANNFNAFQSAIENKIVAEIEGSIPPGAIVVEVPVPNSHLLFITAFICLFASRTLSKEKYHETV
ncbi:DUF1194 domain-containing protein [Thalassotalea eurytherma]|uniref:VWFA domain-containing protein n=1 Tax=Thalassotalea eurytherma TaxID=1144278 RepID=A0ABQ6H3K8_9GAMM|nr:DUF1194 domain-containing protein [Thalassotalea eurytherma]GLX81340.1 hypothetical protein theurythT_07920 [Thalassotalea eurytherma]